MILELVIGFLAFVSLNHLFSVFLNYGLVWNESFLLIGVLKDLLRGGIVIFSLIVGRNYFREYRHSFRKNWILLFVLLGFAVGISWLYGTSSFAILMGLKYGLWYLIILMSATFVGYVASQKENHLFLEKFMSYFWKLVLGILVFGLIWQVFKHLFPDLFFSFGYGPVGDFIFGEQPPLYYRTGPGGFPRLSGIFSGPNNYGYFLASMVALFVSYSKKTFQIRGVSRRELSFAILFLFALSLIRGLSRAAILASVLILFSIFYSYFINRKKIFFGLLFIFFFGLSALSYYKGGSSWEHFSATLNGVQFVFAHVFGYGLGFSGPAVHFGGKVLPENYYLQLLIDIGIVGFGLWIAFICSFFHTIKGLFSYMKKSENAHTILWLSVMKSFLFGGVALLVIGMFLHVFEDSMVNYLFFVPFGLLVGYAQYLKNNRL
ncbi:MAG TPA: hypothetical protein PKC14_00530 [Candidatus Absconditabacterales bacterium]|nr:hypothetical protein [Candidatus Absconditabacterales bacterium]